MFNPKPIVHPCHFELIASPEISHLNGGMPLVLTPISDTQLVRLDCFFPMGRNAQTRFLQANFAAKQLKEGTVKYPQKVISRRIDSLGMTVSVKCRATYTVVTVLGLHRIFPQLVDLLHSLLTEPLYEEEPFHIAIEQALSSWEIGRQKVEVRAREDFFKRLYHFCPLWVDAAEKSDFQDLTTDYLHDYHVRCLFPTRATLLVTGLYEESDIGLLNKTFGRYEYESEKLKHFDFIPPPMKNNDNAPFRISMERTTLQNGIRLGCLLPPPTHPDAPLIRLTNMILGGYFGSRLMTNIREKRGLTYDIHSSLMYLADWTVFSISMETPDKSVTEALQQIRLEMERMAQEPVPEAELQNVKQYMLGNDSRDLEPGFDFPNILCNLLSSGRNLNDLSRSAAHIEKATAADVQRVASKYFRYDDCLVCVAGN